MFLATLLCVSLIGCTQEDRTPPRPKPLPKGTGTPQQTKPQIDIHNVVAVIETAKGDIEIDFFADVAPNTVKNFINNARLGYYKNEPFHRVLPNTLIQAGSHMVNETMPIETSTLKFTRGVIVMAKEPGATVSDATEFFICLDTLELDSEFTRFGKVTQGLNVIDSIKQGDRITKVTIREKG
jgi:peptidyl-prolyl cis-trans isomerase B (cyclophilin B)